MAFETLAGGLELVLPTNNTKNWGTVVRNATWKKINDHTHTGSGDGNKLSGSSLADNSIGKTQLEKNIAGYKQVLVTAGIAQTVDLNLGNNVDIDLSAATGTVVMTVNNPIEGAKYNFTLRHGATVRVVTWPASFIFPGGEEPTQYSSINSVDLVECLYDGTNFISDWKLDIK